MQVQVLTQHWQLTNDIQSYILKEMERHLYTTSETPRLPSSLPSVGQSILCIEFVALCAPVSTALFAEMNTRYFPSGLCNKSFHYLALQCIDNVNASETWHSHSCIIINNNNQHNQQPKSEYKVTTKIVCGAQRFIVLKPGSTPTRRKCRWG